MKTVTELPISKDALSRFFKEAGSRLVAAERATEVGSEKLKNFFSGAKARIELWEEQDQKEASGFNVFDLIQPDENRLSDVLTLLLNPKGPHGQGDLFLRLLLEMLGTGFASKHTKRATVHRESLTRRIDNDRRRMDVLVDVSDLVLGIENKVDAGEQPGQVKDYLEHLRRWGKARSGRSLLIYLTPGRRTPESLSAEELRVEMANNRLFCWSYGQDVRVWLEACHSQCAAPRFKDFLNDFMHYVDRSLTRECVVEQEQITNNED